MHHTAKVIILLQDSIIAGTTITIHSMWAILPIKSQANSSTIMEFLPQVLTLVPGSVMIANFMLTQKTRVALNTSCITPQLLLKARSSPL